jgi:aspartyl-tRNA(Asn)/glutamyl-tRNA(Gln) amidotransferase subunit C
MAFDKETVRKVASLAMLEMDEAELERVTPKVAGILSWIEQLGEVNTDNVEPVASVVDIHQDPGERAGIHARVFRGAEGGGIR